MILVQVSRNQNESNDSLVRRFQKQVQQSRILISAKRRRFYEPRKNKREIRENARRRQVIKARKAYLRKIGKLDDVRPKQQQYSR